MTQRTRPASTVATRDASPTPARLDPAAVVSALGCDALEVRLRTAVSPVSLFAVRDELFRRLKSSGGRPGLEGADRRAKIPLKDEEWTLLEELASSLAEPGFAPSPGQVAGVLLSLSLQSATKPSTRNAPPNP